MKQGRREHGLGSGISTVPYRVLSTFTQKTVFDQKLKGSDGAMWTLGRSFPGHSDMSRDPGAEGIGSVNLKNRRQKQPLLIE
jgi:hypothetical protein